MTNEANTIYQKARPQDNVDDDDFIQNMTTSNERNSTTEQH